MNNVMLRGAGEKGAWRWEETARVGAKAKRSRRRRNERDVYTSRCIGGLWPIPRRFLQFSL